MPASPWLTLRQANEALRHGRPDDAHRALAPLLADGHRKALRLVRDIAAGYAARGERFLRADNPDAAWKELLAAEALNTGDPRVAELRSGLTRIGLAECRAAVEAGNPLHAAQTAVRLKENNARHPDLSAVADVAEEWVLASEMADRGDFLLARATLERLRPRLPCPPTGFDRYLADLDARHERFRSAVGHLADAAEVKDWKTAAKHADQVIAVAPAHRDARQTQMRAWEAMSPAPGEQTMAYVPRTDDSGPPPVQAMYAPTRMPSGPTPSTRAPGAGSSAVVAGMPKRFLLWVDGVGGYLVCLSSRVTFGQATADGPIDIPLFADVSRLHAEITRDGEGYLLESARGVQVNGIAVEKAVLRCGDRMTLGPTCQMLFRQPVAVSPSARLELVSGHRLPRAVDGVLLMADNLILGPSDQVHVRLPWVSGNVILFRTKDGIGVRFPGQFRVDNDLFQERANLTLPAVVSADGFTFAVEPVGSRL